jgi:hypothetical protein
VLQLDPDTFWIWAVKEGTDMRTTQFGSGPMPDGSKKTNGIQNAMSFIHVTFVHMVSNI